MDDNKVGYRLIPYIINTIDYRNSSHGVRVIHKLCHLLRKAGIEAYVTSKVLNNKGWDTPTLFDKQDKIRKLILDGAIVVYPEVWNNLLYSKNPISWRLLPDSSSMIEEVYVYHQSFDPTKKLFYIEDFEHDLFNTDHVGKRSGAAFYIGKGYQWQENVNEYYKEFEKYSGKKYQITRDYQEPKKSWPYKRKDLAKLLKSVEVLYIADPSSQIMGEARFCGCPVVYIGKTIPEWCTNINYPEGFTTENTKESIDKATEGIVQFKEKYQKREEGQQKVFNDFLHFSQTYARGRV